MTKANAILVIGSALEHGPGSEKLENVKANLKEITKDLSKEDVVDLLQLAVNFVGEL